MYNTQTKQRTHMKNKLFIAVCLLISSGIAQASKTAGITLKLKKQQF